MLPPTLSEEPGSLNFGKDRLTPPIIATMTKEGKVTKKWFSRTVIKSSAQLSYANAQDVIEGKVLGGVPVTPEHDTLAIEHDIRILHDLAKVLEECQFNNSTLSTETPKSSFTLDELGRPVDCDQSFPMMPMQQSGRYGVGHFLWVAQADFSLIPVHAPHKHCRR